MLRAPFIPVLEEFLVRLKAIGAIKIDTRPGGGFKLKLHEKNPNAPLSPIYINLRTADNPKPGPLVRQDIDTIGALMWRYAEGAELRFTGIAGIPRAGEPFARALHHEGFAMGKAQYPLVTLGKKEGASGRTISDVMDARGLPRGEKVLIVDDLITRADSKVEAYERLKEAGYAATDVLVFLDREQGGGIELAAWALSLHSIVTLNAMLAFYLRNGHISGEEYEAVKQYLANNN